MAGYATYVASDGLIDYTPAADVAAGDVVVTGNCVAVANRPIKAGVLGALHAEGVFDFVKHGGEAVALFTKVYWDPVNHYVTATGGAGLADAGLTVRAAAAGDATARVVLVPRA